MKKFFMGFFAALVLLGCAAASTNVDVNQNENDWLIVEHRQGGIYNVGRLHDEELSVTCWRTRGQGTTSVPSIFCMTDAEIGR